MTAVRRGVIVVLLSGLTLVLGVAPAWAHSRLVSSDPAQGARVDAPPATVSLTFNEPVQAGFTTVTVIGPDGADYHTGDTTEVDTTVSVAVLPLGPAGTYQLGYRVVSADGHPVAGAVAFDLAKPGPGSDQARPPAGSSPVVPTTAAQAAGNGSPIWPWIVGAVVLVGAGVGLALRTGRP
jgi:methionine-rich copper-binding protein CopC